jgi:hypothetical protein
MVELLLLPEHPVLQVAVPSDQQDDQSQFQQCARAEHRHDALLRRFRHAT